MRPCRHHRQAGFTLIEAIMAIVITGILAGIVAVFISGPVQGYVDSVRRAELTDAADVALRRMTRDIKIALPNSLRVGDSGGTVGSCSASTTCYVEFIMTSAGGRYRDAGDGSSGAGLKYLFSDIASFDVLGLIPSLQTGDFIVVYNLGEGYSPADAYSGLNAAKVGAGTLTANPIPLSANPFPSQSPPLPSPDSRFQVVPGGTKAVIFACPKAPATGTLDRYSNYGFFANLATSISNLGLGTSARMAGDAATSISCDVTYTNNATGRNGLLVVNLTLTSGDESVTLFQQIHVDNGP